MKKLFTAALMFAAITIQAQTIELPAPDMERPTHSVMQAFKHRKSVREYNSRMLSAQDLSDLLWAAGGVNRPNGNLTAPTAMNRQEIRIYVFTAEGVCLYHPKSHTLEKVTDGDHRKLIAGPQAFAQEAPVALLLVADMDKFGSTNDHARWMVGADVGIVTQNINLFCSAAGLVTVTRGMMDQRGLQQLLGLSESQIPVINNPVGYPKDAE